MRKKFLSAFMLGLLALGTASTITSCKDYDGDISSLKNDVSTLQTEKAALETKIAQLQSELEKKESQSAHQSDIVSLIYGDNASLTTFGLTQAQQGIDDLKAAVSDINTLLAGKVNKSEFDTKTQEIMDKIAAINTALGTKVEKSEYDAAVEAIYTRIESVQTGLGEAMTKIGNLETGLADEARARAAADQDLQGQIDALKGLLQALEGRVDTDSIRIDGNAAKIAELAGKVSANETAISTNKTDIATLKTAVEKLTDELSKAKDDIAGNTSAINTLTGDLTSVKTKMNELSTKVDAISTEINTLTVLIDARLRSLVFIPDSYYWGVEATELNYLEAYRYDNAKGWIKEMSYDKKEVRGYDDNLRYDSTKISRVLSFAANYQINPTTADLSKATYAILSNDLPYVISRAAKCGIDIKKNTTPTAAAGILTVQLDATNPEAIKSVPADQMITNFALQATIPAKDANGETTANVTSDYATVYTAKVTNLKLAHAANTKTNVINLYSNAAKSAISPCNNAKSGYGHLMQTVREAGKTFDAQDSIAWDSKGEDLLKYVETHWTKVVDGVETEEVIDAKTFEANFEYEFALTYLDKGKNETDESAHAHLDGTKLIPNAVDKDGKPVAEQDRAQEVGRTPVVRVLLKDKQTGYVLDYGYIRFKIVDTEKTPIPDGHISYQGDGYTYSYECEPLGWSYQTTWSITEVDLYKELGLTRTEFQENYNQKPDGLEDNLDQYYLGADGKFVKLATKYGVASTITDKSAKEDDVMSSTLKWEMSSKQAIEFFVDKKAKVKDVNGKEYTLVPGQGIAIKYTSKNKTVGPDVYVLIKTGETVTINKPSGKVAWNKNATRWCSTNAKATGTGFDEIHVNVPSVEDERTTICAPFEQVFSNVFVGNKVNPTITVSNDKTKGQEYAQKNLTLDLQFDAANEAKEFKGVSGATYVLSLYETERAKTAKETDAKVLYAYNKADATKTRQVVATISGENIDIEKISYEKTGVREDALTYAKDMLNYKAHNELDNNTLVAIVGLVATNQCGKPLELSDNTFDVRFLRPLNVANTSKDVEDANTKELQTIDLMKIMSFTDWREAWKDSYIAYYDVKGVTIEGVGEGEKISTNKAVMTNQNKNENGKSLAEVNGAIDFVYSAGAKGTGILTYRNNDSTTDDFWVKVPVLVEYYWGKVPQTVTINVKHTREN